MAGGRNINNARRAASVVEKLDPRIVLFGM